ncbi:hypothetical protein BT96DRAFT_822612 [Gymnopus androsaceus JB14]|uniref:Uncharacterized protein n=1 Tax=Gymnopus androsaceus JB14 TaxID=1447944 RepID=A0A6A4HLN6_9AGAR|nr:hypothetical protein BT96DRAFT_822612 [Gymnopus androsaceus JB14]
MQEDSEEFNEIEVYVRLLLRRRRGYPLWIPKPGEWLPSAYRQEGVRIGDVGILTEFGGFDYLFNVCLPADHPVNAGRVPQQFRQLRGIDINNTTWSTQEYKPGSYIASNPSHFSKTRIPYDDKCTCIPGVPEEVGTGISFSSSATKGAVLIVPEGGKRIDHQQYSKFYKYAAECARSWYTHVNGPLMARGVHNGALYLVTGCDKARAWGVASFIDAHPGSVSLDFVPRKSVREGGLPEYEFSRCNYASSSSDSDNVFGNQSGCMFLRGLKIAVRFPRFLPKIGTQVSYISDLEAENLLPGKIKNYLPSFLTGKQLDYFRVPGRGSNSGKHEHSEMDVTFPERYQVCLWSCIAIILYLFC